MSEKLFRVDLVVSSLVYADSNDSAIKTLSNIITDNVDDVNVNIENSDCDEIDNPSDIPLWWDVNTVPYSKEEIDKNNLLIEDYFIVCDNSDDEEYSIAISESDEDE